jgi:hypothetical protein
VIAAKALRSIEPERPRRKREGIFTGDGENSAATIIVDPRRHQEAAVVAALNDWLETQAHLTQSVNRRRSASRIGDPT